MRSELESKHEQAAEKARKANLNRVRKAIADHPVLAAKAKVGPITEAKITALEKELEATKKVLQVKESQVTKSQETIESLRAKANELRALPIGEVLEKIYGAQLCDGSKFQHKTRKYELPDGQKIGVSPGKNGGEVWVHQGTTKGAKSAIDLVMLLDGCDYKTALKTLGDSFGSNAVLSDVSQRELSKAKQEAKAILASPTLPPSEDKNFWQTVKKWLVEKRAIPEKLADWVHKIGLVYADSKRNAVFARANGGAFVRGTSEAPFKRTIGDKSHGPFIIPGPNDVIICESTTDALSLKAMYSDSEVIATGGNLLSVDEIKPHIKTNRHVWLAFDNDEQGQKYTQTYLNAIQSAKVLKLDGSVKDWNEALQRGFADIDDTWLATQATNDEKEKAAEAYRTQSRGG